MDTLKKKILTGTGWVVCGKMLGMFLSIGTGALLSRLLPPGEFGTYFLIFSFVSIAVVVGKLGLDRVIVRFVAVSFANGKPGEARNAILFTLGVGGIGAFLVAIMLGSPIGEDILNSVIKSKLITPAMHTIAGVWAFIFVFQGLFAEIFRGFHDIRFATLFGGLITNFFAFCGFYYCWLKYEQANLNQIFLILVGASSISAILAFLLIISKIKIIEPAPNYKFSPIVQAAIPLLATSIALVGMQQFHVWIVGALRPASDLALFGIAHRLTVVMSTALQLVNKVIPPTVAQLYAQKEYKKLERVMRASATLASIFAISVLVIIVIFGNSLLGIIYGDFYRQASLIFIIMALGQLINILTGSPGVLLIMAGRQKVIMFFSFLGGCAGLGINYFLTGFIGITGSAIGMASGIIIHNICCWLFCMKKIGISTHPDFTLLPELYLKMRSFVGGRSEYDKLFYYIDGIFRVFEGNCWRIFRKNVIECFGDSHVTVFRSLNGNRSLNKYRFQITSVRGATVYGLANPRSTTNAIQVFKKRIRKLPPAQKILFLMGEVDVGFLIWIRAKKYNILPRQCLIDTIKRYICFLASVNKTHPNLIVCSAPLPTVETYDGDTAIFHARKEIDANIFVRTQFTMEFNQAIKLWAEKERIFFLDLDRLAYDKKTKKVKSSLLNKNPLNHHYDTKKYMEIIALSLVEEKSFSYVKSITT